MSCEQKCRVQLPGHILQRKLLNFHFSLFSFLWAERDGVSGSESMDRNTLQEWSTEIGETQDYGQSSQPIPDWPPASVLLDDRKRNFYFVWATVFLCDFVTAAYPPYCLIDWSGISNNTPKYLAYLLILKG